ncbi:OLC1v1007974C2 [Oldenlandia corymbosa var. corymbosa]|uniref:OLC1v1007974C2 n=1 Tax=Oldenlandia corymbosa var. corymbosa TaxID=529605 RepID=A0AAV1DM01_OLDCO|nr:OLC1v1007974C2 [Oldenlandia corymbosa var. corymbosa]
MMMWDLPISHVIEALGYPKYIGSINRGQSGYSAGHSYQRLQKYLLRLNGCLTFPRTLCSDKVQGGPRACAEFQQSILCSPDTIAKFRGVLLQSGQSPL